MIQAFVALGCDVCRFRYRDGELFTSRRLARAAALKAGWLRRPKKPQQPGYDLCPRCAQTETRREGL
jgi:hypothetical protein